jgi:hypothetical protein
MENYEHFLELGDLAGRARQTVDKERQDAMQRGLRGTPDFIVHLQTSVLVGLWTVYHLVAALWF